MKYQYKLNNKILFETDNIVNFFKYISTKSPHVKDYILIGLLKQSKGYIADITTTN